MPYEFHGVYYSIKDLEGETGRCYSIVCRWIKALGIREQRVGYTILVDQAAHDQLLAYAKEMDEIERHVPVREACDILRCGVDELTANEFIPYRILRGQVMYLRQNIQKIKAECKPRRGKVDWAKARSLQWEE